MFTLQDLINMTTDLDPANVEILVDNMSIMCEPDVEDRYELPSRDGGAREDCALIILTPGYRIDLEDHLRSFGYNVDGEPIED